MGFTSGPLSAPCMPLLQVHWRADSGTNGTGSNCDGADAGDLYIPVPLGTIIRRKDADEVREFKTTHKLDMTVVLEADAGGINRLLETPDTIPYSVFFNADGKVSSIKHGTMSQAEFDAEVSKAKG